MRRRTARVVLVDERDRVLLLARTDPAAPQRGVWWSPPGGDALRYEWVTGAAARALREATGWIVAVPLGAPVWRRSFQFEAPTETGEAAVQDETWFLARTRDARFLQSPPGAGEPPAARWWSIAELRTTGAEVHPLDLGDRLARWLRPAVHRA